jgi:hypothetical protein
VTESREPDRRAGPDPYPSGIYSVLSYPPAVESASAGADVAADPAEVAVLARIGDIEVTATSLRTPAGVVSLAAASVEVADDREVRTPTWAVVCAIVGFFAVPVLSLAFLLARQTVETGWLRVTVSGDGVRHETLVRDPAGIELARSLAAS